MFTREIKIFALAAAMCIGSLAQQADAQDVYESTTQVEPMSNMEKYGIDQANFWSLSAGPAFGSGFNSGDPFYHLSASHQWGLTQRLALKAMASADLGADEETSRLISFGVGGNFYLTQGVIIGGRPFVTADVGYGFARDNLAVTDDGAGIGVGAGMQFVTTEEFNIGVLARYQVLAATLTDGAPAIFSTSLAFAF